MTCQCLLQWCAVPAFSLNFILIFIQCSYIVDGQVELPGCTGIWTVYHKAEREDATEFNFGTMEEGEFHAYLIISLEARTMVCTCPKGFCYLQENCSGLNYIN